MKLTVDPSTGEDESVVFGPRGVFPPLETYSWIEGKLARIFGEPWTGKDGNCSITVHRWRGKLYLTKVEFT